MSGDGEPSAQQADAPLAEAPPPPVKPFQKRILSKGNKQDFPRVSGRVNPAYPGAALQERRFMPAP